MDTYQQWRDTIGALMSKLYAVDGFDLHAGYQRYAYGRREEEEERRLQEEHEAQEREDFMARYNLFL